MRSWAFWSLFAVVGTALALLTMGGINFSASFPNSILPAYGGSINLLTNSRKLKEKSHLMSTLNIRRDLISINMGDYPHFDPVPSSNAAVKAGPIEHGTPLMPYVPKPIPPAPSHPRLDSPP